MLRTAATLTTTTAAAAGENNQLEEEEEEEEEDAVLYRSSDHLAQLPGDPHPEALTLPSTPEPLPLLLLLAKSVEFHPAHSHYIHLNNPPFLSGDGLNKYLFSSQSKADDDLLNKVHTSQEMDAKVH
jgi:hypothetical protein